MEPELFLTDRLRNRLTDLSKHTDLSPQIKEIQEIIEKDGKTIPFRLIKYAFDKHDEGRSKGKLFTVIYLIQCLTTAVLRHDTFLSLSRRLQSLKYNCSFPLNFPNLSCSDETYS